MGLFGIKTKKEKEADAKAKRATIAKKESNLISEIEYWDYDKCRDELEAYNKGKRDYSGAVLEAIRNKKYDLARESNERNQKRDLDRKIEAKEAEIERLKGRSPWSGAGSDGYYFATRSTKKDNEMAAEVRAAEAELARLKREKNNIGKSW